MIELKNVYKLYTKSNFSIKNINIKINKGEIFGIIGKSGAGKSTLLSCINLLEKPDSGIIKINEIILNKISKKQLRNIRKKIGMIFQGFYLLSSLSVLDNVIFPLKIANWKKKRAIERAKYVLSMVGIEESYYQLYPSQLSGGQQQRVGIARAIANNPYLLLCDEPTSSLDLETSISILKILKKINQNLGLTIIFITHEMSVIKNISHRIAILEKGNLLTVGSTYDIFFKPYQNNCFFCYAELYINLPPNIRENITKDIKKEYEPIVRIAFLNSQVNLLTITQLHKIFKINFNILFTNSEWINSRLMGISVCHIQGNLKNFYNMLIYINKKKSIGMEVIGYVPPIFQSSGISSNQ